MGTWSLWASRFQVPWAPLGVALERPTSQLLLELGNSGHGSLLGFLALPPCDFPRFCRDSRHCLAPFWA